MTPHDAPLLIAVLDVFADRCHGRPRTLRTVAEELNVSEETALSALERLERMDILLRVRGGTTIPVWQPRHGRSPSVRSRAR
jgi:DeoR/GlpR family transcriptional regulator of sugar metabolism